MERTRLLTPPPLLLLLLLLASIRAAPESSDTNGRPEGSSPIKWWRPYPSTLDTPGAPLTDEPRSQKIVVPNANIDAGETDCMADLGLADGTIPDQNITGWPNGSYPGAPDYSSPAGARLNSATAWCVNGSTFPESHATLTVDLGQHRLLSGFKVQGAPTEVHSRDHSSFLTVEYSLDGTSWTPCCSMETAKVSRLFSILDRLSTLDTYYFGVLKLAKYVRFRFDKSSWPQDVQCVRLEIVGCQAGWLPTPRIWHIAHPRGWLDIMWKAPAANLHDGDRPVFSRLPVESYSLEVSHQEGSELVTSREEVTNTRWTISRPIWGTSYVLTLRPRIAGVALDWARYSVRARLGCPDGQPRCAQDGAVFVLPDVLQSTWNGANTTLVTNWTVTSRGWRVPQFMFSLVVGASGTGISNQIIESAVTRREVADLRADRDYEVFLSPVIPELTSTTTYHRRIMLVPTGSSQMSEKLSQMVEEGTVESSPSVAAVTADVSVRAWPRWSGDILIQWHPAVLRGDSGTQPAASYRLSVRTAGRQVYSAVVAGADGQDTLEAHFTGSVAVGAEYEVEVECHFPARNFTCGRVTVVPTPPAAAEPEGSGWLVLDVPEAAGSWSEASATCQRRGGHLASITTADRHQQLAILLERLGQLQAWVGLRTCPPYTGTWSDGSRVRFEEGGAPPTSSAAECCVKLFRTEDVTSGIVQYQGRMEVCDTVLPPLCASKVEGALVYPVEDLAASSEYPLTLDLTWRPRDTGWAPSSCFIQVCPTRDLSRPEATLALPPCTNWTSTDGRRAHITGLPGYHEFQLTVWSRLASVQSSEPALVTARSLSLLPLRLDISRSGRLSAVWQRKVVEGAADTQADVVVRKLDVAEPPSPSVQALARALAAAQRASEIGSDPPEDADPPPVATETRLDSDEVRRQDARHISWSGLELGARYMLALFDVGANDTKDYVVFSAEPTCLSGEYQLGSLCFWPSEGAARYSEASHQCAAGGGANAASASLRTSPWMARISSLQEYRLVKNLSLAMDRSFWVIQQEKRRRRRDVADQVDASEVEMLPGYQPPPPKPTTDPLAEFISDGPSEGDAEEFGGAGDTDAESGSDAEFGGGEGGQPKPCTYVQRGRNGIQSSTSDCEEEMQVICSTNITVTVPEFRERDLRIEPSSSSIRVDWAEPEAWAASYQVTVYKHPPPTPSGQTGPEAEPLHDVRIKRAAASVTYKKPPVVLSDLDEDALYDVTIVRDSAGRLTVVGPVTIRALDPPRQPSMFPVNDGPRMSRALSYVVVIITALLVAIILLLARVPVIEGIYQITLAITLAVGYLFILLSQGGPLSAGGSAGCRAAAAITHLAFSAALAAALLLALALPRLLGAAPAGFPWRHAWTVPLLAAGPQAAVVVILLAAAVRAGGYVDGAPQTCWLKLDVNSAIMWVVVCHLAVVWLAGVLLAIRALALGADRLPPPPKHPEKAKRKSALGRLRFTVLALLLLLAACWALGAAAAFYGDRALVISEAVLVALLAAALGLLCADTFIAGWRPWRQRVTPDRPPPARPVGRPPANLKLTTVHPADGMMIKRTFHFGADPAETDRRAVFSMPIAE